MPDTNRPVRWTLGALVQGDERVVAQAAVEAKELAKALAAQAVARAPDAAAGEYAERLSTLERGIWPEDPLDGYALHSSLGTYLIARLAPGWTPPTSTHMRNEPFDAASLIDALCGGGLDRSYAKAVVADWPGAPAGYKPSKAGLSAALMAGLAEQTLTRSERNDALAQVAFSPHCLARLAATCEALDAVRHVVWVLPVDDDELGPEYITAIAAFALGRPDRALALLGPEPEGAAQRALAEMASTQWNLARGQPANLADDESLPIASLETGSTPPAAATEAEGDGDEDAVLEIVEEVVRNENLSAIEDAASPLGSLPAPPRWSRPGWDEIELDETFIKLWRDGRSHRRAMFGHLGALLGLHPRSRALPSLPLPPDIRTIRRILDDRSEPPNASTAETERIDITAFIRDQQEKLGLSSLEPLLPVARTALRAIAAAAEGEPPTAAAVDEAGDVGWAVRRARGLGLAVRGDLEAASRTLQSVGGAGLQEARWIRERTRRFEGRPGEAVDAERARTQAAALVWDLGVQLGRTIAGTVA